jgi:hypothetical protein
MTSVAWPMVFPAQRHQAGGRVLRDLPQVGLLWIRIRILGQDIARRTHAKDRPVLKRWRRILRGPGCHTSTQRWIRENALCYVRNSL